MADFHECLVGAVCRSEAHFVAPVTLTGGTAVCANFHVVGGIGGKSGKFKGGVGGSLYDCHIKVRVRGEFNLPVVGATGLAPTYNGVGEADVGGEVGGSRTASRGGETYHVAPRTFIPSAGALIFDAHIIDFARGEASQLDGWS